MLRNCFHLVIEMPAPDLVAGMKWLLSPYCQDCGIDNTGQPLSPSEGAREKPPQLLV